MTSHFAEQHRANLEKQRNLELAAARARKGKKPARSKKQSKGKRLAGKAKRKA